MELEDNILDFNKICRLCLTEETVMSSIYHEEDSQSDSVPLPLRIMACVSVEISSNDGLPSQICANCLCQVDGWYKFKDLCENADSLLRKCIKNEPVQVETITQVKSMAQEVKKYFLSEVRGENSDASNQNKNLSPKKKMESRTGPPIMTCPPLLRPNFVMTNQNVNPNLARMPSLIRAVPPDLGAVPSNLGGMPPPLMGTIPCIVRAIPASALRGAPPTGQIILNSVIGNPSGNERFITNFGQLHQNRPVFQAPPVPENIRKNNKPPKKIKPKLCKWTNVCFDEPYTLSGNGSGPEIDSGSEPEVDDLEQGGGEPEPKKFKSNREKTKKPGRKKSDKSEGTKPGRKFYTKDEFGISENVRAFITEKTIYTYRLDEDGNIDVVDIIEGGDLGNVPIEDKITTSCIICNESFPTRTLHNDHIKIVHPEKLKCKVCDKQLLQLRSYFLHVGMHLDYFAYTCPICDKKIPRARRLKEHIRIAHKGEKGAKCEICGREFNSRYYLKTHLQSHEVEKIKNFECEFCGFKTNTKANLQYHISSHLNKREYMCELCGKRFNQSQGYENHKYVHEAPKYNCQFCKRSYRWLTKYQEHLEKAHSDKLTEENVIIEAVEEGVENGEFLEGVVVDNSEERLAETSGGLFEFVKVESFMDST